MRFFLDDDVVHYCVCVCVLFVCLLVFVCVFTCFFSSQIMRSFTTACVCLRVYLLIFVFLCFVFFFCVFFSSDDAVVHYLVEDLWVDVDSATARNMTALHYAAKVKNNPTGFFL